MPRIAEVVRHQTDPAPRHDDQAFLVADHCVAWMDHHAAAGDRHVHLAPPRRGRAGTRREATRHDGEAELAELADVPHRAIHDQPAHAAAGHVHRDYAAEDGA
jgi:hypothetical protein